MKNDLKELFEKVKKQFEPFLKKEVDLFCNIVPQIMGDKMVIGFTFYKEDKNDIVSPEFFIPLSSLVEGYKENDIEPYIKNCIIKPKENEQPFYQCAGSKNYTVQLDGYAIIPKEEYEQLIKNKCKCIKEL